MTSIGMLRSFAEPRVEIDGNFLRRRAGFLYRRKMDLNKVVEVIAVNKDALTHDELNVVFCAEDGSQLFISEFDRFYEDVMMKLPNYLLGFTPIKDFHPDKPFQRKQETFWVKK